MTTARIHHLVAACLSLGTFVLFLGLWIAAVDGRNTDHLIWAVFSLVAVVMTGASFLGGVGRKALRMEWALWAFPLPFIAAGAISTFA